MKLALLAALLLAGCSTIHGHGTRVQVGVCDVIVDDELGHLPPTHGGPEPSADRGNGLECYWRF